MVYSAKGSSYLKTTVNYVLAEERNERVGGIYAPHAATQFGGAGGVDSSHSFVSSLH